MLKNVADLLERGDNMLIYVKFNMPLHCIGVGIVHSLDCGMYNVHISLFLLFPILYGSGMVRAGVNGSLNIIFIVWPECDTGPPHVSASNER